MLDHAGGKKRTLGQIGRAAARQAGMVFAGRPTMTRGMAGQLWNALDAYTYGFTLQRLNFPIETTEYANSAKQFLPMIPVETHPFLRGMGEEVIAGRHDGLQHLEFGLDLLLDGLERLRAK